MADSGNLVLRETDNAVLILTLNRPDVLNAMNGALAGELKAALHDVGEAAGRGERAI